MLVIKIIYELFPGPRHLFHDYAVWRAYLTGTGSLHFLWKPAAAWKPFDQSFEHRQIHIVPMRAEDVSVCWWKPSLIIRPQNRKHMKRIFGHSFHSVTTFLKRQRATGRCGRGRTICYCLLLQAINCGGNQTRQNQRWLDGCVFLSNKSVQ